MTKSFNWRGGLLEAAEFQAVGPLSASQHTLVGNRASPCVSRWSPSPCHEVPASHRGLGGAGVAAFDPFDGTPDGFYDAYPDESTTNFVWNVGIGGSTALSPRFDLFGEYQFMAFGDVQTGQDDFTDGFRIEGASAHEGLVGIRIRLGS